MVDYIVFRLKSAMRSFRFFSLSPLSPCLIHKPSNFGHLTILILNYDFSTSQGWIEKPSVQNACPYSLNLLHKPFADTHQAHTNFSLFPPPFSWMMNQLSSLRAISPRLPNLRFSLSSLPFSHSRFHPRIQIHRSSQSPRSSELQSKFLLGAWCFGGLEGKEEDGVLV